MATALVSLLTNTPVHPLTAMTGEITLSGNVLPVGGIKEKFLAAKRAGVRDVILPTDCKQQVDEDLTPDQIEGVTIHYAIGLRMCWLWRCRRLRGRRCRMRWFGKRLFTRRCKTVDRGFSGDRGLKQAVRLWPGRFFWIVLCGGSGCFCWGF